MEDLHQRRHGIGNRPEHGAFEVQPNGTLSGVPAVDVAASTMPVKFDRAAVDRLAAQALAGSADTHGVESLGASGDLLHGAAVIRSAQGRTEGVVVATDYLTGDVVARSRRMTKAFESYSQMRVLKPPLTGVYLSFFLMVTLFILLGSLWMGSYLAKRITRPVQMLSTAAREIGAGRLDQRVEPQSNDEFGALVEAFNTMAGELATSRRRVERSTIELERKHVEVEGRRRYIETILERITTGVVSVDATGAITTINSAAARLLSLDRSIVGQPARVVFDRLDLQPVNALLAGALRQAQGVMSSSNDAGRAKTEPAAQEIAIPREGQELHLAVVATALVGEEGAPEGVVLVLDDVTPLIRAQKVAAWREVARRLAHEIKNPLTPIQLSAERLRRHFAGAPPQAMQIVPGGPAWFHPGRAGTIQIGPQNVLGHFGELHPRTLEALGAEGPLVVFETILERIPQPKQKATRARPVLELSPFQPVERDFAFVVDRAVKAADIVRAAQSVDRKLITNVNVFDVYEGPGIDPAKKSIAIAVTLQPRDHTLTDQEIEAVAAKIVAEVGKKTGGVLRG